MCKELPGFNEVPIERKYNKLELNNSNFKQYCHKFVFITHKALSTYNEEEITPEVLYQIYSSDNNISVEEYKNEVEIIVDIKAPIVGKEQEIQEKSENGSNQDIDSTKSELDKLIEEVTKTKTTEERKRNIPRVFFDDI